MKHAANALTDLMLFGGAAAVSYGAWEWFHPAGWIVGGSLAIATAVLRGLGEAKGKVAK